MARRYLSMAVCLFAGLTLYSHEVFAAGKTLRVASVQMEVTPDLGRNLNRIETGIREAAAAGARVVVFPETALSGFDEVTIVALDWTALNAAMVKIAALAKELDCYVIYGSATPSPHEKPYNSAIVVGPDGTEIFRYHKSFPENWFEPGERLALFEIDGIPATVIVCHDSRYPELVRIPVMAGARICFYISYEINEIVSALRKQEGYRAQLIARAAENNIWVVQSNGYGPLGGAESLSLGESRMVDPAGVVVAQASALEDALLMYDLQPQKASRRNALRSAEGKMLGPWMEAGVEELKARLNALDLPETVQDGNGDQVRLALMQAVPEKWNLDKNFDTFLRYLDDTRNAQIFVTPECWLDGYAAADKTSTPERLLEVAQDPAASPYLARVAEEARERKIWICFGFSARLDGKLYNTAGLWNDQGELTGLYHKTHLQTHDLQYTPGPALAPFPTPWGPVGIMICADRRWPETARALRLQGARLILNPTYGMHHHDNQWWMRTRAFENQCFIAFTHPEQGLVLNPSGDIQASQYDTPGVLVCDIDLGEAKEDNHLQDRRSDLYGPLVD
ncbi:MAG: carbon-nitrogen hydrolase family protein [Candidatus Hydrogenedentes bacterium]|nr:carbon-nitrogen hydrolase family protein [Candidatus Hydrogenedentota bacterium]